MSSRNEKLNINCFIPLLICTLVVCVATQRETYDHNELSCTYCQPGTHWVADCTASKQTTCLTCPENTYTDGINKARSCKQCSLSCTKYVHQVITGNCTIKSDTRCECKNGYYLRNRHDPHCIPHSYCPVGKGVVRGYGRPLLIGTPRSDTRCEDCGEGFYSNVSSRTEPCKPLTKCEYGNDIDGNSSRDNVCCPTRKHPAEHYQTTPVVETNNTPDPELNNDDKKKSNTTGEETVVFGAGAIDTVSIILAIVLVMILGIALYYWRNKCCGNKTEPSKETPCHNSLLPEDASQTEVKQFRGNNNGRCEGTEQELVSLCDSETSKETTAAGTNVGASCSHDGFKNSQDLLNGQEGQGINVGASCNNEGSKKSRDLLNGLDQQEDQTFTSSEEIYWLVAEKMDIVNTPWKKVIMKLPGKKLEDCDIQRIDYNHHHEHVQERIFQSFQEWQKRNPDDDVANIATNVITALNESNKLANCNLVNEIRKRTPPITQDQVLLTELR